MKTAYFAVTLIFALMAAFSAVGKIRRDPHQVKVIHETIGISLRFFPLLALCEVAGALGLLAGIWYPPLGLAAGSGLALYFAGAIVSHLCVGDSKGIGPACFMFAFAAGALVLRGLTM